MRAFSKLRAATWVLILGCSALAGACTTPPESPTGDGDLDTADADAAPDGAVDADQDRDGEADAESLDADTGPLPWWDLAEWHPLRDEGDPNDDCRQADPDCAADIVQLRYAIEDGTLMIELTFEEAFDASQGSYELFLFPEDPLIVGHSFQNLGGTTSFWNADCSSADGGGGQKHDGCHWSIGVTPSSYEEVWTSERRFVCSVTLGDLGFEELEEVLGGGGAAPFVISRTAEFTDRYPDELWVTSTEVQGLEAFSLVED